jgi:hypothetical protein
MSTRLFTLHQLFPHSCYSIYLLYIRVQIRHGGEDEGVRSHPLPQPRHRPPPPAPSTPRPAPPSGRIPAPPHGPPDKLHQAAAHLRERRREADRESSAAAENHDDATGRKDKVLRFFCPCSRGKRKEVGIA